MRGRAAHAQRSLAGRYENWTALTVDRFRRDMALATRQLRILASTRPATSITSSIRKSGIVRTAIGPQRIGPGRPAPDATIADALAARFPETHRTGTEGTGSGHRHFAAPASAPECRLCHRSMAPAPEVKDQSVFWSM